MRMAAPYLFTRVLERQQCSNIDTGTNGHFLVQWGNGTRAIGFLDTAPFFFNHNFAAAVPVKFAEVQRLNGDAYGKGIYAATDLNYGKGFGRILDEFNGLVENVEANILTGSHSEKPFIFSKHQGFQGFLQIWLSQFWEWMDSCRPCFLVGTLI